MSENLEGSFASVSFQIPTSSFCLIKKLNKRRDAVEIIRDNQRKNRSKIERVKIKRKASCPSTSINKKEKRHGLSTH